jgi:hypothetical protein
MPDGAGLTAAQNLHGVLTFTASFLGAFPQLAAEAFTENGAVNDDAVARMHLDHKDW